MLDNYKVSSSFRAWWLTINTIIFSHKIYFKNYRLLLFKTKISTFVYKMVPTISEMN